jgi:uncharacterized membrane protein (DUF485 family)
MARPKSSMVGFVDLAMTTFHAGKLSSVNKNLVNLTADSNEATQSIKRELQSIKQAQIATVAGLVHVNERLKDIEATSNATLNELKRQDMEKEILGDLKLFLIDVEEAISEIQLISTKFPEYAALLAQDLSDLLNSPEIHIGKFKRMDQDGIKWAKSVIQQVSELAFPVVQVDFDFLKISRLDMTTSEESILSIEAQIESHMTESKVVSKILESLPHKKTTFAFRIPKDSEYYDEYRRLNKKMWKDLSMPEFSYFNFSVYFLTSLILLYPLKYFLGPIIEDIEDDYLAGILCFIWVLGILFIAFYNDVLDRRQKKISKESGEIYELAYNSELERLQGWHLHHAQTIDQLVNDLQDARLGLLQSWKSIEHMVPK